MAAPDCLILHGNTVTVILELVPGEVPLWRYWGPRIPDGVMPPAPLRVHRPPTSFAPDHDQPLSLFPTFGNSWFGNSALLADQDGANFSHIFKVLDIIHEGASSKATIRLVTPTGSTMLSIALHMDPASDVLTVSTSVTNLGALPMSVHWLAAATLPLPPDCVLVRSFTGRHNDEFVPIEDPLSRSGWHRDNVRGLTSHDSFPGAVVLTAASTDTAGLTFGAQLGWSGNHRQRIGWCDDGRYAWQFGEWLAPGEVQLAPGATLAAPDVLATLSVEGTSGVARNFHAAIRARSDWPGGAMRPRPVHINTWEALYFAHDHAALVDLADSAAALGIERFVLDDGWFHGRADDRSSLGDWWPDAGKYPAGLGPLAHHVVAQGMTFGLWVEPEMVNPDSDLFRAHPDWVLGLADRPAVTARNQLVLDMARSEVADHLFACLDGLLTGLPITYLKWDHNRDLIHAAGPDGRARYRRQVLATYALMDRLRARHPDVEIEACAGGGGRIDAGIARRTHRFWTSDNIDAVSRLSIQQGFLQFMPPERMGAHVGAAPAHATGRSQSLHFRAAVALAGHFGVELDVRTLDAKARRHLADWIARYKSLRDTLHTGAFWQGQGADNLVWQAYGDADLLIMFLHRSVPPHYRHPAPLALPMLDPARDYQVERIDGAAGMADRMSGAWLTSAGLATPPLRAERSAIFRVEAVR